MHSHAVRRWLLRPVCLLFHHPREAGRTGFEPVISPVTGERVRPLCYRPNEAGRNRTFLCLLNREPLYPDKPPPQIAHEGFDPSLLG